MHITDESINRLVDTLKGLEQVSCSLMRDNEPARTAFLIVLDIGDLAVQLTMTSSLYKRDLNQP
jgi:hypothetical protein